MKEQTTIIVAYNNGKCSVVVVRHTFVDINLYNTRPEGIQHPLLYGSVGVIKVLDAHSKAISSSSTYLLMKHIVVKTGFQTYHHVWLFY